MSFTPPPPPKISFGRRIVNFVVWFAYYCRAWLRWLIGKDKCYPPLRTTRFGSLRRVTPISPTFGDDRGLPLDRYYVESFLYEHRKNIHGRVLESGGTGYTRKFGEDRVKQFDVINLREGVAETTFRADLAAAPEIPSDIFDCVILAQTFQFIYETRAAIETAHRILKPGGTLIATMPGISHIGDPPWTSHWCWNFTGLSAKNVFSEAFGEENIEVKTYGNVFIASSFLYGLSVKEVRKDELDYHDPNYEVTIGVKATKSLH